MRKHFRKIVVFLLLFVTVIYIPVLLRDPDGEGTGSSLYATYARNSALPLVAWKWVAPGFASGDSIGQEEEGHYEYSCVILPFEKMKIYSFESGVTRVWPTWHGKVVAKNIFLVATTSCEGVTRIKYLTSVYR